MAGELPPLIVEVMLKTDALQKQMEDVQGKLDGLGKAAEAQKEPISSLKEGFKELGASMAEFLAAAEIIKFLKESADAAIENQKSYAMMEDQLRKTTGATASQTAAIDKQLEGLAETSGVMISNIRPAYDSLVRATGDSTKAMQLQKLAMDISAGTGKDLSAVTASLGKAYNGNSAALGKLVPGIKGAKDQMAYLEKNFKGAAETAGNSDPYARMNVMMERIKVTLGKSLLPLFGALEAILQAVMPVVDMLSGLIGDLVKALMPLIKHLMSALMPAFSALMGLIIKIVAAVLPPLIKVLDGILIPVIDLLVQYLVKFVIPAWTRLVEVLQPVVSWIATHLVAAFKQLMKTLGPIYETVIAPIIHGLMQLLGIKEVKTQVKVEADTSGVSKVGDYLGGSGSLTGDGGGTKGKTIAQQQDEVRKAIKAVHDKMAAAQKAFNDANEKAQAAYNDKVIKANETLAEKTLEITKKRDEDVAKLEEDHANKVADIQKSFAAKMQGIVQQSMDGLRNAFKGATGIDVGALFAGLLPKDNALSQAVYKEVRNGVEVAVGWWGTQQDSSTGVGGLLDSLKGKLAAAKTLSANAAALAGAGFSQTFIEQIVSQGPDAGNKMAQAILDAAPDSQKELQNLFGQSQELASHGMDDLSKTMYEKSGLATEELRNLYGSAQTELATALADENAAYGKSMKEIQKTFDEGIADAKKTRDSAIAAAHKDLTDALAASAKALSDSLTAIEKAFGDKIASMKGKVGGLTGAIAGTYGQIDKAQVAVPFSGYTAAQTASMQAREAGQAVNFTTNIEAKTDATPAEIQTAVVNGMKYNLPYLMAVM